MTWGGRQKQIVEEDVFEVVCGGAEAENGRGRGVKRASAMRGRNGDSFDVVCDSHASAPTRKVPRAGYSGKKRGRKPKNNGTEYIEFVASGRNETSDSSSDDDEEDDVSAEMLLSAAAPAAAPAPQPQAQPKLSRRAEAAAHEQLHPEVVGRSGSGRKIKQNSLFAGEFQRPLGTPGGTPRQRTPTATPTARPAPVYFPGTGEKQVNVGKLPAPGCLKLRFKADPKADYTNLMRLFGQIVGPITVAGAVGIEQNGMVRIWNGYRWVDLTDEGTVKADQWIALLFSFENGRLDVYVDGVRRSRVECAWDYLLYDLVVGAKFLGQNGSFFQGEMDPPQTWPYVLSEKEIADVFGKDSEELPFENGDALPSPSPVASSHARAPPKTPKASAKSQRPSAGTAPDTPLTDDVMRTASGRMSKYNSKYKSSSDSDDPGGQGPLWVRAFRRRQKQPKKSGEKRDPSKVATGKEFSKGQRVKAKFEVPTKKGARVEWFKGTVLKTNFNATDKTFEVTVKFDADDQKEVYELPDEADDLKNLPPEEESSEEEEEQEEEQEEERTSRKKKKGAAAVEPSTPRTPKRKKTKSQEEDPTVVPTAKKTMYNLEWFVPSARVVKPHQSLVGRRVRIYWDGENSWFQGIVDTDVDLKKGRYHIVYDDGDDEELMLPDADILVFCPPDSDLLDPPASKLDSSAEAPVRIKRDPRVRGARGRSIKSSDGTNSVAAAGSARLPIGAGPEAHSQSFHSEEPAEPSFAETRPPESQSGGMPMQMPDGFQDHGVGSVGGMEEMEDFVAASALVGEENAADHMMDCTLFSGNEPNETVEDLPPIGDDGHGAVADMPSAAASQVAESSSQAEPADPAEPAAGKVDVAVEAAGALQASTDTVDGSPTGEPCD